MRIRDYLTRPPVDFISKSRPIRSFFLNAIDACELAVLLALFLIRRPKLKPVPDDENEPHE